jgi:glycosyltransferase involved in cell wall biosynthesis
MGDYAPGVDSGAGGTEVQTVSALRRSGHDVDTVWANDLGPRRISHGGLHNLLEFPYRLRHAMLDRLRRKSYDVVHVSEMHGYLAARAHRRVGRGAFIHRSHGLELRVARDLASWRRLYGVDDRPLVRRAGSLLLERILLRRGRRIAVYADGHIVSATQCREFLRSELGTPREHIAVIPQAAPDAYIETPASRMDLKRLRQILYVGQFAFIKAPMILAQVLDEILQERNDVEVTWVCAAVHHREARALLSARAQNRVRFIGWLPQRELIDVYDAHGMFLFPSFFEGFGKACLEAMTRGLCVIAANNGGAHDLIESGVSGLLVRTGDVAAMTRACLGVLADPEIGLTLAAGARKVAERYSWERVARETEKFYERRLQQGAATATY